MRYFIRTALSVLMTSFALTASAQASDSCTIQSIVLLGQRDQQLLLLEQIDSVQPAIKITEALLAEIYSRIDLDQLYVLGEINFQGDFFNKVERNSLNQHCGDLVNLSFDTTTRSFYLSLTDNVVALVRFEDPGQQCVEHSSVYTFTFIKGQAVLLGIGEVD